MKNVFKIILQLAQEYTPQLVGLLARFWDTFKVDNPVAATIVQVFLVSINSLLIGGYIEIVNADISLAVEIILLIFTGAIGSRTFTFLDKNKVLDSQKESKDVIEESSTLEDEINKM